MRRHKYFARVTYNTLEPFIGGFEQDIERVYTYFGDTMKMLPYYPWV